jgi:hypothetical protein
MIAGSNAAPARQAHQAAGKGPADVAQDVSDEGEMGHHVPALGEVGDGVPLAKLAQAAPGDLQTWMSHLLKCIYAAKTCARLCRVSDGEGKTKNLSGAEPLSTKICKTGVQARPSLTLALLQFDDHGLAHTDMGYLSGMLFCDLCIGCLNREAGGSAAKSGGHGRQHGGTWHLRQQLCPAGALTQEMRSLSNTTPLLPAAFQSQKPCPSTMTQYSLLKCGSY